VIPGNQTIKQINVPFFLKNFTPKLLVNFINECKEKANNTFEKLFLQSISVLKTYTITIVIQHFRGPS